MSSPIIVLTTDFGASSTYVAQLKAVLLSRLRERCHELTIVDATHEISPHSIREAEVFLRSVAFSFPLGAVHVVVIDPGVGSARRPIAVRSRGMFFVGPDNGVLGRPAFQPEAQCRLLDRPELFPSTISPTFHGRDIFAPVAAEIAAGLEFSELGTPIHDAAPSTLPEPVRDPNQIRGVSLGADRFGNILTNIAGSAIDPTQPIRIESQEISFFRTYEDGPSDGLFALVGSDGFLEIARRQGSAANAFQSSVDLDVCASTEAT